MRDSFTGLDSLAWLEPWSPVTADRAGELERVLARELTPGHPLHGRPAHALGARDDTDDVLFEVQAPLQLAVVHLTHGKPSSPEWPLCMLFDSIEAFIEGCMEPDHLEHVDGDV